MLIDNNNHHHHHRYYHLQQQQQQQQQDDNQSINGGQRDSNNNNNNNDKIIVNNNKVKRQNICHHRQQQQQQNLNDEKLLIKNDLNNMMQMQQQQHNHQHHFHHQTMPVIRSQTLPSSRKINNNNNRDLHFIKNRSSFNENHFHQKQCSSNNSDVMMMINQKQEQQQQQQSIGNVNNNNNNNDLIKSTTSTTTTTSTLEQCSINATMTIRRLLQLYELGEYHEAANIISRLPYQTFRSVVLDLPVDIFVEAIPSSLPILDALYAKIFFSGRDLLAFGFKFLHPENVVSNMIKMFAICDVYSHPTSQESISICKKLLKVILIADPSLRKQLLIKKALIDRAVEGMGHHGLVGTSNDALMNLHEALRLEFERVIQQYKGAIAKIDELSSTNKIGKDGGPITRSLSQGPAPTFSSHQRLLSLKQEEIHDRLNKNRSLLCALEPCFRTNHSLQILLAILQKRIDYDKETLFQFGQLSREYSSNSSNNFVIGSSTSSTSSSSSSSSTSSTSSTTSTTSSTSSSATTSSTSSPSINNNNNNNQNSTIRNNRNHNKNRLLISNQFERDSVVAPVLMRFSHGCNQVLNLLKEIQNENETIENDENTIEQQQQQQIILTSQSTTSTNTGSNNNININNNEMFKNQSTITTTTKAVASTTATMTTMATTMNEKSSLLSSTNTTTSSSSSTSSPLSSFSLSSNCTSSHVLYQGNNTALNQKQQQQQYLNHKTIDASSATNTTITTNDDSSDISGYHSDSDMSPISIQSPLAKSNNNNNNNNINDKLINNHMSAPTTTSTTSMIMMMTETKENSFIINNQSKSKIEPNVAIMTGNINGTTILDGQVTINSGHYNNHNICSSINNDNICSNQNNDKNSICRIEVDGKTMNNNINNNFDEQNINNRLKIELIKAQKRIEQLEIQHIKLEEKLLLQSKQLFSIDNKNYIEKQQQNYNNNIINNLIENYEYLFSKVRINVIDALNQFDELKKDSSELKIKLLFSIIVLAHRSTEQTFKDLYLNLQKLLKLSEMETAINNNNNNNNNNNDDGELLRKIYYDQIESSFGNYLRITSAYFDIEPNVQNVCTQIWDTLFDYPCLEKCPQLIDYIRQCVRLCWSLNVQQKNFQLDIETKIFRKDWHNRTIDSNQSNNMIKCYIWPTLFQHGICVHKGIVIT